MKVERLYSLGQVTEILNATPRQVQWLREKDVVVPKVLAPQGGRCLYSTEDLTLLFVALTLLDGCSMEIKRGACEKLRHTTSQHQKIHATGWVSIHMDVGNVRQHVQILLKIYEEDSLK